VLNSAENKARLVPQGIDISTGSPGELKAIISADYAQWGKVMGEAGIKGE
jgi:tripartite-type tricarboxylate transporter receptor subunit TctC